jgi:hypothetical protein
MYIPHVDGPPPAEISDTVEQLQAVENLVMSLKLEAILAYERTGAWRGDGAVSIEAWVGFALGVRRQTAVDYVRLARALRRLPLTLLAFRGGRLSFDQVRALVTVATPSNEAQLIDQCTGRSAEQVERMIRAMRPVSVDEADGANADRWVRWWWSNDQLSVDIAARLPAPEGAMVVGALERIAQRSGQAPVPTTHEQRCADALVELTCAQDVEADGARPLIVVHADVEALRRGEGGTATVEAGPPIASETARRLACDARTLVIAEGKGGTPIGIGRRSRVTPPSMLRLLRERDKGCRFPGCGRTRWIHAHHKRHWADGGRTDSDNLVLLCGAHHRLVHEGRVRIDGSPDGELHFFDRRGTPLVPGPHGIRPSVRRRLEAIRPALPDWLVPASTAAEGRISAGSRPDRPPPDAWGPQPVQLE